MASGNPAHLLNTNFKTDVTRWLAEDCPSFDYGGFVVGDRMTEARLFGKSAGILAGVPFFDEVFRQLDCTVDWHHAEGASIEPVLHCATVRGPCRKILLGERVALNMLARCSGIATKSRATVAKLAEAGYGGVLAGTRKTTPGFRLVEKYGMLIGGCDMHRYDLSSMIMLKDNHVMACGGSISSAVENAKKAGGFALKTEVECQNTQQAVEAVIAGADVIMLDNFPPYRVAQTIAFFKAQEGYPARKYLVEISGGITEETVASFAIPGVDIISTSSIHQGTKHLDFSLKILS